MRWDPSPCQGGGSECTAQLTFLVQGGGTREGGTSNSNNNLTRLSDPQGVGGYMICMNIYIYIYISVLLCVDMHRVKWSVNAKQSVCSVVQCDLVVVMAMILIMAHL